MLMSEEWTPPTSCRVTAIVALIVALALAADITWIVLSDAGPKAHPSREISARYKLHHGAASIAISQTRAHR